MKRVGAAGAIGLFCAILLPAHPSRASLADLIVGDKAQQAIEQLNAAGTQLIKQLLDGFDATSHSLVDRGAHEGNLLLVQGGNQMQLIVSSARAQFGSELDHQVSQASDQLRPFLVMAERLNVAQGDLRNDAFKFEDTLALDLNDLPLSNSYFGIRRVLGTVMVQNRSESYPITLRGPHFGMATSGETITYEVKLDGEPLAAPELGVEPTDAVFRVPADKIKDKFQLDKMVSLPLEVTVTRVTPRRYLVVKGAHDVVHHTFTVSLLPDLAGKMTIVTTRPVFAWKPVLEPETQDHAVAGPYTFSFAVANPSQLATVNPGEQKISDQIKTECHANMQPGRLFPNGAKRLSSDPIFKNGWDTPKYIGNDEGDWAVASGQILKEFGINWSTWEHNACGSLNSGLHCHLPAAVLMQYSTDTSADITGCSETSLGTPQWRNNHTQVSIDVIGGKPEKPAPWSVTFQTLSYIQTGTQPDPPQTYPVYTTRHTPIEVVDPLNASSKIVFVPYIGKPIDGLLGYDVSDGDRIGPRVGPTSRVGDVERFDYTFSYPSKAP